MPFRAHVLVAFLTLVGALAVSAVAAGETQLDARRVTIFGDSAATAMAYDPEAKRILGRGIDLRLEVAACRRLASESCPYDGVRPPNVVERAQALGRELGSVVVVVVGYNDYEGAYAGDMEEALGVFRKAGVEHVVWATLREGRPSWAQMNGDILRASKRHPEMSVLDWNAHAQANPAWLQPDGIHLTPEGARGMATLVSSSLVQLGVAPKPPVAKPVRTLSIVARSLPYGRTGRGYSARLRALGGDAPYRWTRIGGVLPPGLRLASSGLVKGVPAREGRYRVTLRVIDRAGTRRSRSFVLGIA